MIVLRGWKQGMLCGFALSLLILTSGCGDSSGKGANAVSGKVTYKGKNLTDGSIEFHGSDKKVGFSAIAADGSYSMVDPPVGDVTVVVKVPTGASAAPPGVNMTPDKPAPVAIPEKYSFPETSGVKKTLAAGKTTVNIELP